MMTEETIHQLRDPKRYPGTPSSVRLYQTHLSVVCIAGDDVYKLKKPVRLAFVDFSTRDKRLQSCHDEVRLNRRLCPDLYLGVVPLYETPEGVTFVPATAASVVDHAVHMRRLPAERMMDVMLTNHAVTMAHVEEIAQVMAAFHQKEALDGSQPEAQETPERLHAFARANFEETASLRGDVFDSALHRILEVQNEKDFASFASLLQNRAKEGRVAEGHGDLHTRNICLCEPVAIYDCIEFNRNLRVQDVAAENAFLVMDLRYRGRPDLGQHYLDTYVATSGDDRQRVLLPMLCRYRAMVRAKVAAIAAGERELDAEDREACRQSVQKHVNLAAVTLVEERGPLLLCACGLPASGKSHLFSALEQLAGWPRLSSDRIRKERAGLALDEHAPSAFYTPQAKRATYEAMLEEAARALQTVPVVLLDANFATRELRQLARGCAERAGATMAIVYFDVPEREIARRMALRKSAPGATDADMDVYRKLAKAFEVPSPDEGAPLIRPDWQANDDRQIAIVLGGLLET